MLGAGVGLVTAADLPGSRAGVGQLASRCTFGAYTGGVDRHAALEQELGVRIPRYVTYQVMGEDGRSNWPQAEAGWCARTGHTLVIAWDIDPKGHTFADIIAGRNDASLNAFFQEARQFPGQVVLRMWWEMNDASGPTKVGNDALVTSVHEWKRAWQYVHTRARTVNGATNVQFFFCANGTDSGHVTPEQVFPGESYVDVVGIDAYNGLDGGAWTEFDDLVTPMLTRMAALAPHRPLAIGEIGTADDSGRPGANKATWLTGLFTSTRWSNLSAVDFFSVDKERDWRIDETPASVAVARHYLPMSPQKGR